MITNVTTANPNSHNHPKSNQPQINPNGQLTSDTFFVFLGLVFISLVLYLTFHYLWKKHRKRSIATLYKIDEYRYSRLSQNEVEGDNAVLYGDSSSQVDQFSDEEEQCKPATLLVEPVPLISTPHPNNTSSNVQSAIFTATSQTGGPPVTVSPKSGNASATLILQDSDEDLLQ